MLELTLTGATDMARHLCILLSDWEIALLQIFYSLMERTSTLAQALALGL
jgi:hypothetical protein